MANNSISTKTCTSCKLTLPATNKYFYKQAKGKYGVTSACKICSNKASSNYNKAYPEKAKIRQVQFRQRRRLSPPCSTVLVKECSTCKTIKIISDFKKQSIFKDGFSGQCKECLSKVASQYGKRYREQKWWIPLLNSAKSSAKNHGREYALNVDFILDLYEQQQKLCYWLAIPLLPTAFPKHPRKPSIDRLDPSAGYTPGNVVLCCYCVNIGRQTADVNLTKEFFSSVRENIKYAPCLEDI